MVVPKPIENQPVSGPVSPISTTPVWSSTPMGYFSAGLLARIIHEGPTAAAHLRALAEEIGVRLLDVG